jgi:hypothetical protein
MVSRIYKYIKQHAKSNATVTVGREQIQDINEVIDLHKGRHISPSYLRNNMFQLNDLFSIPQATLLSDIVQYFRDNSMRYTRPILFFFLLILFLIVSILVIFQMMLLKQLVSFTQVLTGLVGLCISRL